MMAERVWSTPWSRARAGVYSDLFPLDAVREDVVAAIRPLLARQFVSEPRDLALEVVASTRQSACLLQGADKAVILFDLSQSMLLKRLCNLVRDDAPYDEFANVLAAASGLAVAGKSKGLCAHLLASETPADEGHYIHEEAQLREFYSVHLRMLPELMFEWQASLIDGFILGHELAHYHIGSAEPFFVRLRAGAENAFAFAFEQVCYEQRPDFEALAQENGATPLGREHLERIRQDLVNRRAHYLSHKTALVEEILCDAHGFAQASMIHESLWKANANQPQDIIDGFLRLAKTYFLILALSDLHQAMIRRAKQSAEAGVEADKAGDIADMHLRKVALVFSMAEWLMPHLPAELREERAFAAVLGLISQVIAEQKACLDALILAPVTRVIRHHLLQYERAPAVAVDIDKPWRGYDFAKLFGDERLASTFRQEGS